MFLPFLLPSCRQDGDVAAGKARDARRSALMARLGTARARRSYAVSDRSSMRSRSARLAAAREQQQARGQRRQHAEDRKGVSISHDGGLLTHDVAKRDDGLTPGGGGVADAVADEIGGELVQAFPDAIPEQCDIAADDVGMELLPLGHDRRQYCGAESAAEITQHVEHAGRGARVSGAMPAKAIPVNGVSATACPIDRTMLGTRSWSPA